MRNALTPPPGTVSVEQYTRKYSEHSLRLLPMVLKPVAFLTGEAQVPVAARTEKAAEEGTRKAEERAQKLDVEGSRSTNPCRRR